MRKHVGDKVSPVSFFIVAKVVTRLLLVRMARKQRFGMARKNMHTSARSILPVVSEEELVSYVEKLEEPFLLILDGVQDPHNLGACMRTADAAGVDLVIAPKKHTVGITETVRAISCGGVERVPYVQVTNLVRVIEQLKELDIRFVGTGDEESTLLYEVDLSGPLGIVMGAEATGLRRLTAEKCDHLVRIPMLGGVDCLNLSVATGVCLFEAVRQRMG